MFCIFGITNTFYIRDCTCWNHGREGFSTPSCWHLWPLPHTPPMCSCLDISSCCKALLGTPFLDRTCVMLTVHQSTTKTHRLYKKQRNKIKKSTILHDCLKLPFQLIKYHDYTWFSFLFGMCMEVSCCLICTCDLSMPLSWRLTRWCIFIILFKPFLKDDYVICEFKSQSNLRIIV